MAPLPPTPTPCYRLSPHRKRTAVIVHDSLRTRQSQKGEEGKEGEEGAPAPRADNDHGHWHLLIVSGKATQRPCVKRKSNVREGQHVNSPAPLKA